MEEAVQVCNQVFFLLLLVTALDVDKPHYATPLVFKNAIDQQESHCHELRVSLNFLDNFEEESEQVFCVSFLQYTLNYNCDRVELHHQ